MQRTFVAIALALTLSCASASYIATQNYVKGPIQVVQDNETNFTSANGSLTLGSVNAGELDIIGSNYTLAPQPNATTPGNLSATSWVSTYRKLDGKSLSASTNTSLAFTSATGVGYSNGYALAFSVDNDTGIPQLYSYQTKVTGGNTIKFNVTSNKDATYSPMPAAIGAIGKNIYVFYVTSSTGTQVNVTNFAIGGTAKGSLEFTLTTTFNSSLQVVWGESLGSNQLYANWLAGTTPALTYATVDVSKGSATATAATAWGSNYTCKAFATDKKWYGDLCYFTNGTSVAEKTINYYIRFNGTALVPKTNVSLNATTQRFANVFPYGPYIAVIYSDSVATQGNNTYSYEIFNLDSWSATKNSTVFLTTDSSSWSFFRVVSGGLYTLTSQAQYTNTSLPTYSSVQVGLVLGSSYLTSVLGFIMTIVAGVLLF